eukprot:TRINITY_DN7724_c0_g1_i1.p1 TRINITY_DN7724_c0_g1~~TRINITY_DN7724_c0_g1_i1.p1  ORF type:complete len:248 (-),score=52.85 TRINITY_DN7724_c0_g1_i1:47-790(-)
MSDLPSEAPREPSSVYALLEALQAEDSERAAAWQALQRKVLRGDPITAINTISREQRVFEAEVEAKLQDAELKELYRSMTTARRSSVAGSPKSPGELDTSSRILNRRASLLLPVQASDTGLDPHQQHQLELHQLHQAEAERRVKQMKAASPTSASAPIRRPSVAGTGDRRPSLAAGERRPSESASGAARRPSVSKLDMHEKTDQRRREQESRILVTETLEEQVRAEHLARFMARMQRRDSKTGKAVK